MCLISWLIMSIVRRPLGRKGGRCSWRKSGGGKKGLKLRRRIKQRASQEKTDTGILESIIGQHKKKDEYIGRYEKLSIDIFIVNFFT